jgi:hypothetical protein
MKISANGYEGEYVTCLYKPSSERLACLSEKMAIGPTKFPFLLFNYLDDYTLDAFLYKTLA